MLSHVIVERDSQRPRTTRGREGNKHEQRDRKTCQDARQWWPMLGSINQEH